MTVYAFYIFDRHTECIYQRRWTPPPTSTPKRPASSVSTSTAQTIHTLPSSSVSSPPQSTSTSRPQSRSQQSRPQSSASSTPTTAGTTTTTNPHDSGDQAHAHTQYPTSSVTPKAANEAKLLFGVIFSLRNLTRQLGGSLQPHSSSNSSTNAASTSTATAPSASSSNLSLPNTNASSNATNPSVPGGAYPSGGYDEFLSYTTGEYKLHYYETATSLKFCMMTDPRTANLRVVLHQIWANLWVEYVVRNPLAAVEHGVRGEPGAATGVGNELFEMGLDRFVSQVVNPV